MTDAADRAGRYSGSSKVEATYHGAQNRRRATNRPGMGPTPTGDVVTAPREAVEAVQKALLDEGAGPGNSIHSWRCEHPDMYGPCDCVAEVARAAADAAVDALGLTEERGSDEVPGRSRWSRLVGPWTEAQHG